jgi:hypothetical protein
MKGRRFLRRAKAGFVRLIEQHQLDWRDFIKGQDRITLSAPQCLRAAAWAAWTSKTIPGDLTHLKFVPLTSHAVDCELCLVARFRDRARNQAFGEFGDAGALDVNTLDPGLGFPVVARTAVGARNAGSFGRRRTRRYATTFRACGGGSRLDRKLPGSLLAAARGDVRAPVGNEKFDHPCIVPHGDLHGRLSLVSRMLCADRNARGFFLGARSAERNLVNSTKTFSFGFSPTWRTMSAALSATQQRINCDLLRRTEGLRVSFSIEKQISQIDKNCFRLLWPIRLQYFLDQRRERGSRGRKRNKRSPCGAPP